MQVGLAAGSQAILSRALHLARAEFPFLEKVRAGIAPETCFEELVEHINDVEDGEARKGLLAMLGILLDPLVAFIDEDLTLRLCGRSGRICRRASQANQ